jgi:hypothetical protein
MEMETMAQDLARRAAQQLTELNVRLPAAVEAQLQSGGQPPLERFDASLLIALAGLVLNVAKFAWDIYREQKKQSQKPLREAISRRIRLEIELPPGVTEDQRDRVIATVVAELPS